MMGIHKIRIRGAQLLVCMCMGLAGLGSARTSEAPPGPQGAFESLQLAVMLRDRDAAKRFVDPQALHYYDRLLATAQTDRDPRKAGLDFEERAIVNALRRFAPTPVLRATSSAGAVRELLGDEKLSVAAVEQLSLQDIKSDGRTASGMLAIDGQRTPLFVHYQRDGTHWAIARVHLHPGFLALLERTGVEPDLDPASLETLRLLWAAVSPSGR